MKWLVCALCCLYLGLLAPRTLTLSSVFGDEGAYALPLDLHRQGLVPYRDYDPPCGPLYFVLAERPERDLLSLRLSAVAAYCLAMVLLTAWLRKPAMTVFMASVGPQVAGHVPYTDLFCMPLFMLWLMSGRRPTLNTALAVMLGFLKPQFGVLCLAANWAMSCRGPVWLRFLPWWGGLALVAGASRFPILPGIVALLGAHHIGRSSPDRRFGYPGLLLGLAVVAVLSTLDGIPFYLYPQAMLARATHFREHVGTSPLCFYPLWALAPLFLKPRDPRWLYGPIALFALQLVRPLPDSSLYALGIVLILASYPLVLVALTGNVDPWKALACLAILGSCYDLGYLHARWLPILFGCLPGLWRWTVVVFLGALAAFNLPYFLGREGPRVYVPLETVLVTPDPATELVRLNARTIEAVDLPGLAFLLNRYTEFQKKNPQYYWLLNSYPDPIQAELIVLPSWSRHVPAGRTELSAPPGYRVFR